MEEQNVGNGGETRLRRLLFKSSSIGIAAALIGWGSTGPRLALGLFAGSIAAAIYAWGYVSSHLGRAGRQKFYDSMVARSALIRMATVGVAGAGAYLAGRHPFIGFLIGFGVTFAVLIVSEIGHIKRDLKTRGLIGGI